MFSIASIPAELTNLPQWLIWRYETRDGKPTKVPYTSMGYRANVTNPEHCSTFENACLAASRPRFAEGIGFVFRTNGGLCGIDLDHIWQSDGDEGAEWAAGILKRFADTYGEGSPSDSGYKIWCRATAPRCGRWTIGAGAIEVYNHSRFFTVTGRSNRVTVIADHQDDIEALVANLDGGTATRAHKTINSVIPQGQRHKALVSLAGTMHRRGMCAGAIEVALLEVNTKQCEPPYDPHHIHQIIESMAKWQH